MAFSMTKDKDFVAGDLRITSGTFTNAGGSTGGSVYTGLQKVYGGWLQHGGSAAIADKPSIVTLPTSDPMTIKTTADKSGWWFAWGV